MTLRPHLHDLYVGRMVLATVLLAWAVRPAEDPAARGPVSSLQNPFEILPALGFALLTVGLIALCHVVYLEGGGR